MIVYHARFAVVYPNAMFQRALVSRTRNPDICERLVEETEITSALQHVNPLTPFPWTKQLVQSSNVVSTVFFRATLLAA